MTLSSKRSIRLGTLLCVGLLSTTPLTGCGGDDSADAGDSAVQASAEDSGEKPELPKGKAPEFDSEARYEGKTLAEYAVGLDDLSASVRKRAIEDIVEFGVNAYPLKDRMRTMALEDTDDDLRVAAYAMLFEMQDPDAAEFLLEHLRDPNAMQSDQGWHRMAQVASHKVDEELLAHEGRELAGSNPEHAERLMRLSSSGLYGGSYALPHAIAEALIGGEHSDAVVPTLLQMLPELELEEAERIAYVQANHGRLPNPAQALTALRAIGSESAFDVALEILAETAQPVQTALATISGFPASGVPAGRKLDAMAAYLPASTEAEVQQVFAAMQNVVAYGNDESAGAKFEELLVGLAERIGPEAQSAQVRALALVYLCEGVGAGTMSAAGLDPVFDALQNESEEIVIGTAAAELAKLVPRAPSEVLAELPDRMAMTVYARDSTDEWSYSVAQGMLDAFAGNLPKLGADAVAQALTRELEAHPGHGANFQVLQWMIRVGPTWQQAGADMPTVAALAGRLIADEGLGAGEYEWLYQNANFSYYDNMTRAEVETIIAFYEVPLLEGELPEHRWVQHFTRGAMTNLYHYRQHEDQPRYAEFVQRVANEASPSLRFDALNALNSSLHYTYNYNERTGGMAHIDHALAGKAARIKPTQLGKQQPLTPADFATGEPDEVFLLTRAKSGQTPTLGNLTGLESTYRLAFLDEGGVVMAIGSTDDAAILVQQGAAVYLTHPQASHALMYAADGYELAVGDETGLDPELLALF